MRGKALAEIRRVTLCRSRAGHGEHGTRRGDDRRPGTYVVDKAGVFDAAQREHLEKWLKELEQSRPPRSKC